MSAPATPPAVGLPPSRAQLPTVDASSMQLGVIAHVGGRSERKTARREQHVRGAGADREQDGAAQAQLPEAAAQGRRQRTTLRSRSAAP